MSEPLNDSLMAVTPVTPPRGAHTETKDDEAPAAPTVHPIVSALTSVMGWARAELGVSLTELVKSANVTHVSVTKCGGRVGASEIHARLTSRLRPRVVACLQDL